MKALRMLLVAVLGALSLVAVLSVTSAAPAGAAACPTTYPPTTGPSLSISTTTPFPGQVITVAGTNFLPNKAFDIVMESTPVTLAHVTTDASGNFTTHITIPRDASGHHVIRTAGEGATSDCPANSVTIDISTPTGPNHQPLGSTGSDILMVLAIALGLFGVGLILTMGGRRRHGVRHSTHRR